MYKDRDELDEIFRSKLYDFEADVLPEDWNAIEHRLPHPSLKKTTHRTWYYWAAAACITLMLVMSGIYFAMNEAEEHLVSPALTSQVEEAPLIDNPPMAEPTHIIAQVQVPPRIISTKLLDIDADNTSEISLRKQSNITKIELKYNHKPAEPPSIPTRLRAMPQRGEMRTATKVTKHKAPTDKAPRKWSFGMGAGSLSAGTNSSVGGYTLSTSSFRANEVLTLMNAVGNTFEAPKTDINHKMPFSIGFSVSRYLSNRWALQTGLSYSLLASDWKTEASYWGECKQRLHFLGIPVGITYKIAEWNCFFFYASGGGKVELNVAGKLRTELNSPEESLGACSEKRRMKEPYFSVNGRAGVSHPIIRILSAYAEVGADYYFGNGSEIETYYTEKPFRVGLQIGFRLGF